ncbi:hypothetical protein [Chondromyces crocatus]|uniref:Uncharacterized protein n=1 Tax=Chondromyces crocatus TaxID=52 RepID=A0A0K1EPA1_CHOCO|nr:hypothetical protein [Chondromyces crocatus]AKT42639.1 uncharacterized protein CMC5_068660 [Chondromyces crocatus]
MIFRLLVALPLLLVLLLAGVSTLLPDPSSRATLMMWAQEGGKALGVAGALAAALAFERGDYLRRAWGLQAAYMLLILRDAVLMRLPPGTEILGLSVKAWDGGVVALANMAGVAAAWMMARAWEEAGFEMPAPRSRKILVGGAALVLALVFMGKPLAKDVQALLAGDYAEITAVISSVADMLATSLIAPVLLTVLAMRGGVLAWPWGMFTASMVCWLFFDAASLILGVESRHSGTWEYVARDSFRVLACLYACAAGLAQRAAISPPQLADDGELEPVEG